MVSKLATIGWGLFACVVAMYAANQGSLIEVVNRYGSFFYGSLLGVFMLAILTKRATATGAFWGLIAGMAVVLTVAFSPWTPTSRFSGTTSSARSSWWSSGWRSVRLRRAKGRGHREGSSPSLLPFALGSVPYSY